MRRHIDSQPAHRRLQPVVGQLRHYNALCLTTRMLFASLRTPPITLYSDEAVANQSVNIEPDKPMTATRARPLPRVPINKPTNAVKAPNR